MEDITSLVLKVESGQVTLTRKELDKLSGASVKAEKTTDKVAGAFKRLLGPLLATISAYQGLKKLVSITREFDILNAQLITSTGSAENAAIAFGAIQDFATNTPFQLGEVTEAFVQLVNRGLDPSEESLTNIGNFASAFGRNILDATRAIGQATTGEFESLKQFGIVARKVGDEVNFTFRGMTTTVAFNAQEIQGYMNDLAANNFAGAMEERMNTLDGALSNLADSWDKFWLTLSQSGSGAIIEEGVRGLIMSIEALTTVLQAGDAADGMGELFFKAEDLRDAFITTGVVTNRLWKTIQLGTKSGEVAILTLASVIAGVFNKLVIMVAERIEDLFNAPVDGINDFIYKLNNLPPKIRKLLGLEEGFEYLEFNFDIDTTGLEDFHEAIASGRVQAVEEWKQAFNDLATADEDFLARIEEAQAKLAESAQSTTGDRLAGFGVGATGDNGPSGEDLRSQDAFEKLRESLLTEEEAIHESYEKRKQIILDSTLTTEEEKAKVMARLEKSYADQIRAFEFQRWDTALSSFDDFQNNLLVLAKTGSSEIAGIYKAAAIANTIIKTYESATSAYAAMAGIPLVGPALGAAAAAAAVAAGLANVQAIASQQVGQFASGGIVPGSNFNGDNLNAGVNSGEMILNFSQQKQLLDMANGNGGQGGSKPVIVNVENYGNGETEVTERETDEARIIDIAVNRAVSKVNNNIRTGAGDTEKALQTRDKRTKTA